MKKILCTLLMIVMLFSFCSCKDSKTITVNDHKSENTNISKESIEEFMSLLNDFEPSGFIDGCKIEKENCYNVTPPQVASETDMKIFKFSDSCASYVMLDNEIYILCASFVNAVPCDFDGDGNKDLLVASSCGSGIHRSTISVFNSVNKESLDIYDAPYVHLIVTRSTDNLFDVEPKDDELLCYYVLSAKIQSGDNNLANLSYTAKDVVGHIEVIDDTPTFVPYKE